MMGLGICYKTLKLHKGLGKHLELIQPLKATGGSVGKTKKKDFM